MNLFLSVPVDLRNLVISVLALGVDARHYAKVTDVNAAQSTVLQDVTFPDIASKIAKFCEVLTEEKSALPSDFIIKRAGLNSAVNEDQVPARIVYPKSIAEVQDVVNATARLQEQNGGQICIRGSGSGFAGLSWSCDNGTVLDMSEFRVFNQLEEGLDIQFGADDMQVIVGASTTLGDLHVALAARNRALPLAKWGDLSVVGFTIGGGFSEVSRHYGLACDWITSADLILADGSLVTVKPGDNLLWHVKGGGGGVGVITSLTFNLIPYLPHLISYSGTWSSIAAAEIFHWWSDRKLNTTMSDIVDNVGMRLVFSSSIPDRLEMNGLYLVPDDYRWRNRPFTDGDDGVVLNYILYQKSRRKVRNWQILEKSDDSGGDDVRNAAKAAKGHSVGQEKERRDCYLSRIETVLQLIVVVGVDQERRSPCRWSGCKVGYVVSVGRKAQGLHNL